MSCRSMNGLYLVLGILLFIIGFSIILVSHHVASVIAKEVILRWRWYHPLKPEFLKWVVLEITGVVLVGISLGIMFHDVKKSITTKS